MKRKFIKDWNIFLTCSLCAMIAVKAEIHNRSCEQAICELNVEDISPTHASIIHRINPMQECIPNICDINEIWNINITNQLIIHELPISENCPDLHHLFLARSITDILHKLNLESATVLYTEQFVNHMDALLSRTIPHTLVKFNTWHIGHGRESADDILATINGYTYIPAIVVMADKNSTIDILYTGRRRNLTSTDWTWIIASPVHGSEWQPYMEFGDKVIFIDYISTTRNSCGSMYHSHSMEEEIKSEYDLWEFSMSTESVRKFGTWTFATGVSDAISHLWEFTTFENKTFNITTIELPIFHFTEVNKDGEIVWKGICIEILNTLAKVLNFNYTITTSIDNKWGAPVRDQWNGMVGMVYRKEVEWGLAKFTVTSIRDSVIDYAMPFWHEPAVIVMKKPVGDSIFLYFGPFRWEVWFTLSLTVPFFGLFVAACVQLDHTTTFSAKHPFWKQWYLSSWVCFGVMVQQGHKWNPMNQSGRLMIGFYWFFSIVAAATYTGNLIAVLAVPKSSNPVQTLKELALQDRYTYGAINGAAVSTLIEHSTFEIYQILWNKSMQYAENNVKNHEEGLARVKKENYVYLGERAGVAPTVFADCDYAIGKEEFFPSSMAFIFPEKSPLIPIFNQKIATMIETGLVERWRRMYHPIDQCSANRQGNAEPASIKETQGGFILLCGVVSLAAVQLLLEYAYRHGHLDKYIKLERLKSFNIHGDKK